MKIQLMSDLHFGHKHFKTPKLSPKADVLVIAGDTYSDWIKCHKGIENITKGATLPIIFVLGNHDYYGNLLAETANEFKGFFADKKNYFLLEKEKVTIDGVNFIGTTLWTDLDRGRGAAFAQMNMPDYPYILKLENGRAETIVAQDTIDEFDRNVLFLKNNVNKGDVVITHHMPSFSLVAKQFVGNLLTDAFATNLDDFILDYEPALWLFGHTHIGCDKIIGNTRCVCNPFGYPFEGYKNYKDEFLIEI